MPYTTTPSEYVDYMYQLPENAMLKAIEVADTKINKLNVEADTFDKYISSINALPNHKSIVDETVSNYRNKIDSIRKAIESNPSEYRKYLPDMRNISRSISNDKTLKSAQERYNEYTNWKKTNDELSTKNELDNVLYNRIKNELPNYIEKSIYNPETQEFSGLNLPSGIPKTFDFTKASENYIKDMKPKQDAAGTIITPDGKYIIETTDGAKKLSAKEIGDVWQNSFMSDTQAQNSYAWYASHFGKEYADNMINSAKEAAMRKYQIYEGAKTKVKESNLYRDKVKYNHEANQNNLDRYHELQLEERERNNHIAELAGLYAASKNPNATPEDILEGVAAKDEARRLGTDLDVISNQISKSQNLDNKPIVKNINDKITFNPYNGENKLTSSIVTSKFISTKNKIAEIDKQMSAIENDPAYRNQYLDLKEQKLNQEALLTNYSNLFSKVRDFAIKNTKNNGFKDEDLQVINNPSIIKNLEQQYQELLKTKNPSNVSSLDYYNSNKSRTILNNKLNEVKKDLDKKKKVLETYNQLSDYYYDKLSKETSYNVDYVKFGDKQNDIIKKVISDNIKSVQFIDPNTGNNLSKKTVTMKPTLGDFTPDVMLSFDKNNPKSLINYLEKQGKNISDVIEITGISKPVPGYGVTATVKLNIAGKSNSGNLNNNNTYLMTLPSYLMTQLGNKLNLKDTKQKEIFDLVKDNKKANFISKLEEGFYDVGNLQKGLTTKGTSHVITEEHPITNNKYFLKVTPVRLENKIKYQVEPSNDGINYNSKVIFNSLEDIADNLYSPFSSQQKELIDDEDE
jgi:hypothetical protein